MELKDQKSWSTGDTSTSQKTCQSCGAEVDKSSVMCPICGEPTTKKLSFSDMKFDIGESSSGPNQPSEGYYKYRSKKSKTNGLTSFLIVLVVVVCFIFVGFFLYRNVFGHKHDGTYKYAGIKYKEQTYSSAETALVGYNPSYLYFKIKGDTIYLVVELFGTKMSYGYDYEYDNGHIKVFDNYGNGVIFEGSLHGDTLEIYAEQGSLIYKK